MNPDLQAAQDGDADALGRVLESQAGPLRAALTGRIPAALQSMLSIDDVLQQTFTDAFLGIERFRPTGPRGLENWLRTIAEHNLRDAIRLLRADRRGGGTAPVRDLDDSTSALFERITGSGTTPSRHLARSEAVAAVRTALAELPAMHRDVLERIDLRGESVAEVAASLGRSPGSVHMLRARAQRWLADLLGHPSGVLPDFS